MKSTPNLWGKLARSLVILGLLILPARAIAASGSPQVETLSLNAGETRVIDNLSRTSQPDINVISNSRALVVHSEEPGKLVLLGAERGEWKITVTQADGRKVTYDVTVSAIRNAANPLAPGEAPAALSSSGSMAESAAARPLDSGAGPLAAGASAALPGAAAAGATTSTSTVLAAAGGVAVPPAATASSSSSAAAASIGATPSLTSQTVKPVRYRTDPSIIGSGLAYSTEGVATSGGKHYLPANGIDLRTGTSQVIDFAERLHRVSIADTKVADVQVINPYQLNLIAHKPGFTTLAVWTGQGHYEERQVRVDPTGKQQVMLNTVVAELDLNNLENQGTNISAALANAGVSLVGMPGAVAAPFTQTIQPGGQSALGGLTGTSTGTTSSAAVMPPGGQLLPLLLSQNLTYGLATQNGGILTQTFFQFLEQHNLGRILAEPKLLANSGEQAKFLSGGEIPIVVAQALNTSVVFKQFGTSVVFVPTVVGVNDIELLVKPEVSQPDYTHGVQLFGFTVPAFVTRRAETMVRLRDDQTLIIAGLILNQKTEQIEKVPYLGDIPYLGGLFRNTSWTSNQTDLMIAVTPQIVRPLPPGAAVFEPSSRGPLSYSEIRTTRLSTPDPGRPRF
jgi:Flp pilus assembly secretin CpaC